MKAREKILDTYSAKVFKNRKDHIIELDEDGIPKEIGANSRTIPGMMVSRGCCYAGCKGVVLGPLRDVVTITHGPIGCGFIHGARGGIKRIVLMDVILLSIHSQQICESRILSLAVKKN